MILHWEHGLKATATETKTDRQIDKKERKGKEEKLEEYNTSLCLNTLGLIHFVAAAENGKEFANELVSFGDKVEKWRKGTQMGLF